MDATLVKGLTALLPAGLLFSGAVTLFLRGKTVYSFSKVVGSGGLVVIDLTPICEALRTFPWMQWG